MTVPFRIEIPSSRGGVRPYLIERTADGRIRHDRCVRWRYDHGCRHVDRALALADHPTETFVADACEVLREQKIAWFELLGYARRGDEPCGDAIADLLTGIFAGLHAAEERVEFVDEYHEAARARDAELARREALGPEEAEAEHRVASAAAFAEFGS